MKLKRLLIFSAMIAVFAAGCRKDDKGITNPTDTTKTTIPPQPYAITEDFESGVKGAYADGNINLATGIWDFNDALIGNTAPDIKDGLKSVRLRTGSITMNFDISGIKQIKIKHAKYGNDGTSTWQLQMSADGGTTFTQLGKDISETSTTLVADSFAVTATTKVRFRIIKAGTTRINIDDVVFTGTGDPGFIVGTPDTGGDTDTGGGSAATARPVVLGGADVPPTTGDNSNMLFGNPSNAQTSTAMGDNYLIDQGYYVESYNATRGEPNWVSWHLDNTNTTNATGRLDNFAAWSGLPGAFYAVQSNSYSGSGFDRGHNCPSADRTSSVAANGATFLMTNMIPQAPQNNQQTWNKLESDLRLQTLEGNEVYIIMGSYGKGGVGSLSTTAVETINGGHVTVPSNVWKIAVIIPVGNGDISRVTGTTKVIAVNTPNINSVSSDWKNYITTVRAIETATGYNLLSALPQAVQDAVETQKSTGL